MPSSKKKNLTRKPKQDQNPAAPSKTPQSTPRSVNNERFRWNITNADFEGEYGLDKIEKDTLLKEVIPALHQYENMTWGEIEGKKSHFVDLDKCSGEAQKRLKEIGLDDLEQLFSLRIGSKKRILGRRQGAVFYVLWWDPKHQVCPSKKKYT